MCCSVEDLASEGTSKLNFVRAIRQAGGEIDVQYLRDLQLRHLLPHTETSLAAEGITLLALATWWDVAEVAEKMGRFEPGQYEKVQSFLQDPENWPEKRAAAAR